MKKNILFVVDERKMGGVSVLLEDMVNMINFNKYNIDILVLHNNGRMLENINKKVRILYGTPYFSGIDYTLKEALLSFKFKIIFHKVQIIFDMKTGLIKKKIIKERKKILDKKYDTEIAFKDGFTAIFSAYGDSLRKIHWLHYEYKKTNPNEKYNKLIMDAFNYFDNFVAVSDSVEEAFNAIYHKEYKSIVINNLVDTKKIKEKSKEECEVILNKEEINVVSVGRLHKQKGFDRVIDAIKMLKDNNLLPDNFKYRLYGDGTEKKILNNKINEYKLNNYVFLMGEVKNPYKYLKNNDLFILSSIYEPFGLVIVEAMTLGIPVLACENHATSELIQNEYNGYITENSTMGIYDGMKYLINNKKEINKYKKNLKKYNYNNDKIIKQIEEVLSNEN